MESLETTVIQGYIMVFYIYFQKFILGLIEALVKKN